MTERVKDALTWLFVALWLGLGVAFVAGCEHRKPPDVRCVLPSGQTACPPTPEPAADPHPLRSAWQAAP